MSNNSPNPVKSVVPILFLAAVGLACGIGLIALIVIQMQPQVATHSYWLVREEVRMVERDIGGGKKVIVPFQTKAAEPVLQQEKVTVTMSPRESMILYIYAVIAGVLLLILLICLGVLIWAWKAKTDPPAWAQTWANSLVSGFAGVLFGFLGGQSLPGTNRDPMPPPTLPKTEKPG